MITLAVIFATAGMMLTAGSVVTPATDDLLGQYEKSTYSFEKMQIGDIIVYHYQRTIDDAIVEGDFIQYQFDADTLELIKKTEHWRTDVPEHVDPAITQAEAEAIAGGKAKSAQLYIISPESEIYRLNPTPSNPCWIVTSSENGKATVAIIDAMEGTFLGYGTSPPQGMAPAGDAGTPTPSPAASPAPAGTSPVAPPATPVPAVSPAGEGGTAEEIPGFPILSALSALLVPALLQRKT